MNYEALEESPLETANSEDSLAQIKAIAQGPNADLFWRLVDIPYNQREIRGPQDWRSKGPDRD